jgi:5-methylcytosine-specific restriction protein A
MTSTVDLLADAVAAVREVWPGEHVEGCPPGQLMTVNDAIGRARRLLDAAAAQIAAEISHQSRPELGGDSLARQQGFRNANLLVASTLGTSTGEAAKLARVGDATAPRLLLTGDRAPAKHPHVAGALSAGAIGKDAAAAIISLLERVALRAGAAAVDDAEKVLVVQAQGLTLDQLAKVLARAEAYLDPDGVAPREEELRAGRSLHIREERDGMIVLTARLDPERAAPVKVAIEAIVAAELAAQRDVDATGDPDAPRRSVAMMQADALAIVCEHLLGCAHRDVPMQGATVVVRLDLDALETGAGHATIDGIAAPVSVGTARRMAADAGVVPCVLGGDSEILDWGRQKRLYTKAQRLALIERDGGCVGCGAPPGHCKVHHLRWWSRDAGPTDLDNGVLLCTSCHHRIHDNGWDVRIEGRGVDADVWLIPPAWIDASRTPRPGG